MECPLSSPIPQAAPALRFHRYRSQIERALADCLDAGSLILGPQTRAFEDELAEFLGTIHVVTCNSGTDALFLSLKALGIGPGDEVIAPALTAAGTAMAITMTGARPRFVDVNHSDRCLEPAALEAAITRQVKGVVVVHLHGNPAPMEPIMAIADQHSLLVVEDCAQAIGANLDGRAVGTFGQASAFSFYPTKNLGCMGDGGAVATADHRLAEEIRSMRNYGLSSDRQCQRPGINSRLDEVQAAVLRLLLPDLAETNQARRAAAKLYDDALASLPATLLPEISGSVYHQYVIEVDDRDRLQHALADQAIGTAVHYDTGLHKHPFYLPPGRDPCVLPITERLSATMLSLPIQPELMGRQQQVIDSLGQLLAA